jgi:drug/metabolite transporter (DMT)-like permease
MPPDPVPAETRSPAPQSVIPPRSGLPFKSKTVTAGLAFLLGVVGAHRFYLFGLRDKFGWAHVVGTLLGVRGVTLLMAGERASATAWVLAIVGAISLLSAFLAAIVYGLRPDARWDARFNSESGRASRSGWTVIFIVILSLFIGAVALMGGLAISFQAYFETHASQQ